MLSDSFASCLLIIFTEDMVGSMLGGNRGRHNSCIEAGKRENLREISRGVVASDTVDTVEYGTQFTTGGVRESFSSNAH